MAVGIPEQLSARGAAAQAPSARQVLIRMSGDISTKARATQRRFVQRLATNLKDAIASEGLDAKLVVRRERMLVETGSGEALEVLARVFGVQSLSRVEQRPAPALDAVVRDGVELFRGRVAGRRYAVRARRVGDRGRAPFGSQQLERALGAALQPYGAKVDLTHPEVRAQIELFDGDAFFFTETRRAHGGLPLGVEGRALALVSGGFDSAVAAWQMQKRGVALDFLFCNLGGRAHELGVLRVLKVLADRWGYGTRPRLHALDFEPVAAHLMERVHPRYRQVVLKRLMLRAAERVAARSRASALVTGEAVGQVSSQTLRNLSVISPATRYTVLRPLAAFNKDEIIEQARRIGTYELSSVVQEYCALVPRRPATGASLPAVLREEEKLDPGLIERAAGERAVLDLRELDPEKLEIPEIELEHVPGDATLIDLRSRTAYRAWHYPGALHLDFARALRAWPSFERGRTYVFYCEVGLKSAHLAERMRREGFSTFHFKGGLRPLLRYARAQRVETPDVAGPLGALD